MEREVIVDDVVELVNPKLALFGVLDELGKINQIVFLPGHEFRELSQVELRRLSATIGQSHDGSVADNAEALDTSQIYDEIDVNLISERTFAEIVQVISQTEKVYSEKADALRSEFLKVLCKKFLRMRGYNYDAIEKLLG